MPERLWNMLKLVPGISASRKNSLITGLARIDENTDELILSVYHLPEPTEFLDDKRATYYAWYYDNQKETWGKIGELQSKNNLTYSLKKRGSTEGNGVFITVETKGREPKEPGEIIIASDPELFYKDLITGKTVNAEILRTEPVLNEERLTSKVQKTSKLESATDNMADREDEQLTENREEVEVEMEIAPQTQGELTTQKPDELTDRVEVEETEGIVEAEFERESIADSRTANQSHEVTSDLRLQVDDPIAQGAIVKQENSGTSRGSSTLFKIDEQVKDRFFSLYDDLQVDSVIELLKNRYSIAKEEVDLKHYWNKCKDYMHDLYEDLELGEIYEEIQDDLKDLLHKIDLEGFWDKVEDLIRDFAEILELDEWILKIKCWVDDLDFNEMHCKVKKYLDAVLDVVDIEKVWYKVKCWVSDLLNRMNLDEIMIWIKIKIYQMREMNSHQLKVEINNLFSRFIDDLKMPELKMAVLKVALKDKVEQVGSFFKHLKSKVELTNESSSQLSAKDTGVNLGFDPQISYQNHQASYHTQMGQNRSSTQQSFVNSNQQAYYNPNQTPYASPYMSFFAQRNANTRKPEPSIGMSQTSTYTSQSKNPYYSPPKQVASMSSMYSNPYIFKSGQESTQMNNNNWGYGMCPQQQVNVPYSSYNSCHYNCPCMYCWQYYQSNFRVGNDALGKPRYFYDEEDDYYYFITPDGELVRKS